MLVTFLIMLREGIYAGGLRLDLRRFFRWTGVFVLNPSEHSSGATIRRGPITKTGNALARTCLVEAA